MATTKIDQTEITELEKIEATRVDGVTAAANGFPILMLKQIADPAPVAKGARDCPKCDKTYDADHQGSKCENCGTALPDAPAAKSLPDWHAEAAALVKKAMVRGKVDESADIDGGQQAIALVGKLIGYEAQELAAGNLGEVADIGLLADAAQLLRQWVSGESAVQDGNVMPATALMQSAAWTDEQINEFAAAIMKALPGSPGLMPPVWGGWTYAGDDVVKTSREFSDDERKKAATEGNALPDGSYPIPDADALRRAAVLARSGHGDAAAAKRLIARRAKELGVANPLEDDDTAKSEIAKEEATVDTVTQETGDLSKVVEDAVTKATAPLQERITSLDAELAKVKATPVPGGPMMSVVPQAKAAGGEDHAAKAIRYEQHASTLADPVEADLYRQAAAQERAKITTS